MRILPITRTNIIFKSKNDDFLDNLEKENQIHSFVQYNDINSRTRESIRRHILGDYFFRTTNEDNNRYIETIEDLYIPNLQKINTNCYRGSSLLPYSNNFDILRKSGIISIIDLHGSDALKECCLNNDINYFHYLINIDYWANPIFETNETLLNKQKNWLTPDITTEEEINNKKLKYIESIENQRNIFIINLKKLIDTINQKNFYICCECGEYRTPYVLALNTFFNPKWNGKEIFPTNLFIYEKIITMYKNLTKQHKDILEIDEKYYEKIGRIFKKIKTM